ncbi:hypothetical protein C9426_09295 [Serratia sp. S1B]|nr:hypothetical protein C9426_09295 [Serratia sp. S1B]
MSGLIRVLMLLIIIPITSEAAVSHYFRCGNVSLFVNLDDKVISNTYAVIDGYKIPFATAKNINSGTIIVFTGTPVSGAPTVDLTMKVMREPPGLFLLDVKNKIWDNCYYEG